MLSSLSPGHFTQAKLFTTRRNVFRRVKPDYFGKLESSFLQEIVPDPTLDRIMDARCGSHHRNRGSIHAERLHHQALVLG